MNAILTLVTALAFLLCGLAQAQVAPAREAREALAPSGKLRVAFLGTAPTHAVKDAGSGELKGPAVDLGREIARRIGVPFEPVAHSSFAPVLAGAKGGEWDIAMMGISAERGRLVDFTAPYMIVEFSFLVPEGARISTLADIDRQGVRVAVLEKSSPDAYLSGAVRNAALVRLPTLAEVVQSLAAGKADVAYGTKAGMLAQSAKLPGSRVLEGAFGGEETAIAVPKERRQAAEHASRLVQALKAEGLVKAAIDRAALRGVIVAPDR